MDKTIILKSVKNDSLHCAIIENNRLVEMFSDEDEKLTGNIYLGRVDRVVNALDALFVNIGENKNGFLRKKDIPQKFLDLVNYDIFKPKSKILVQVKKDPVANKGPQLTANISLAGRFLVVFPFTDVTGVSKKIETQTEKERLYKIASQILEKYGIGVIIRTASEGVDESYLFEEAENLIEKWNQIYTKFKRGKKAKLLHHEESSIDYILREKLTKDVSLIITNNTEHVQFISKYIKNFPKKPKIEIIDSDPFDYKNIYNMYKELFKRKINLPSGGEIIIDKTEALTVIDVNSKHLTSTLNQQETALITNLEAVEEIFRQLRLRNIGGIIIIDFIDMNDDADRKKILEKVNEETKKDKSKIEIFGFTRLGLLELSRKRTVKSFFDISTTRCPVCNGTGLILSPKTLIKEIYHELNNKPENAKEVIIKVHPSLKGKINKDEIKKLYNLETHIHYTYHDPKTFELTWKI
ncbi:MAG: ribonuclease [Thermosipho sp. (in: thermotogales)]|nr:ribonuclease [Thermosipho sp. (in: thermotogales)]MDN5324797.1 ribonuclease [Thermosipho sp. (in: thermotogales)]